MSFIHCMKSASLARLQCSHWQNTRSLAQSRTFGTSQPVKSFLELAREVDAFPSRIHDQEAYNANSARYYEFKIEGYSPTFGLLPKSTVKQFHWPKCWNVSDASRTLTLSHGSSLRERSDNFNDTLRLIVESKDVPTLAKLRGEIIPTYGPDGKPVMHIDRAGSILFGTVMYGIQMLAYTKTDNDIQYWVPRRSKTVRAYAGMLDQCVGGALNSGETPIETLVREAKEEASLPEDHVRNHAKSFGVVSYHMNHNANNEPGHQPQVMYTYSLELPQDMKPEPADGEVEKFELMTLDQVKAALWNREFKANCVLTWISYLTSEGIINAENERDLHKITTHLHRKLDFPAR